MNDELARDIMILIVFFWAVGFAAIAILKLIGIIK